MSITSKRHTVSLPANARSRPKSRPPKSRVKELRGHEKILSDVLAAGQSLVVELVGDSRTNRRYSGKLLDYDPYSIVINVDDGVSQMAIFKGQIKYFFPILAPDPDPEDTREA